MNFKKMNAWLLAVSLTATAAGSSGMPLYIDATQLGIKKSANEETLRKNTLEADGNEKDYDVDQYGVITKYKGNKAHIRLPEKKHGRKICEVGQEVFQNNMEINSVILPKGVKKIGQDAFFNCTSLESIQFPDSLVTLETGAFQNCTSLKRADLSKTGITKIEEAVFQNCRNLEEIILPKGLTKIEANAFHGCGRLKSLFMSNLRKLNKIGSGAFANCISLSKLTLPEGIQSIAGGCFANCIGLEEITIPARVQELGLAVLAGNSKVTIKGTKNSLAYDYAMKNRLKFIPISQEVMVSKVELLSNDMTYSKENIKQIIIKEGKSVLIDVKIPLEATNKNIVWECNKEGIVSILEDGSIVGMKKGFVIVEAKAEGGIGKKDCIEVNVI